MAEQRRVVSAAGAGRPPPPAAAPQPVAAGRPRLRSCGEGGAGSVWGAVSAPLAPPPPGAASPTQPEPASLDDIIRQEQRRLESSQIMRDKSLALIQVSPPPAGQVGPGPA